MGSGGEAGGIYLLLPLVILLWSTHASLQSTVPGRSTIGFPQNRQAARERGERIQEVGFFIEIMAFCLEIEGEREGGGGCGGAHFPLFFLFSCCFTFSLTFQCICRCPILLRV